MIARRVVYGVASRGRGLTPSATATPGQTITVVASRNAPHHRLTEGRRADGQMSRWAVRPGGYAGKAGWREGRDT